MTSIDNVLEELRSSLLSIDLSLIDLIAARLRIARLIGRAKARTSQPVHDESREITVANLLAEEARRHGIPEDLVRTIYFELARESKCQQLYCPVKARVAIYGYGGMARSLAYMLARAGCWVAVTGRRLEKAKSLAEDLGIEYLEEKEAIKWTDILLYAVPSDAVTQLLRKHWSMYRESMLVLDIASVKKPIIDTLKSLMSSGTNVPEYASLHPLFGPRECAVGEIVAIIPVRLESWRRDLEQLLANGLGLRLVYIDADTHDMVMSINQVLHHLTLELYSRASKILAKRLGVDEVLVKELVTSSLRSTLGTWERLEKMKKVVHEIRRLNPYTDQVIRAMSDVLQQLSREVT